MTNKISTMRSLVFQLYTDLSTLSTDENINLKRLKLALYETNCQNSWYHVDECSLNNYFPLKKRNGMGFVVYNLKINLISEML